MRFPPAHPSCRRKKTGRRRALRGKTGRVYGDLLSLLTVMKGIPLAYNKDSRRTKKPFLRCTRYASQEPACFHRDASHDDLPRGYHGGGRGRQLYQRHRLCGLSRQKGRCLPRCASGRRRACGVLHQGEHRADGSFPFPNSRHSIPPLSR